MPSKKGIEPAVDDRDGFLQLFRDLFADDLRQDGIDAEGFGTGRQALGEKPGSKRVLPLLDSRLLEQQGNPDVQIAQLLIGRIAETVGDFIDTQLVFELRCVHERQTAAAEFRRKRRSKRTVGCLKTPVQELFHVALKMYAKLGLPIL